MRTALLLLAAVARAQMTAPPAGVTELHGAFIEAVEDEKKAEVLSRLARTAPVSNSDVTSLYDIFMRFPEERVRTSVLSSLALMRSDSTNLEGIFLRYLDDSQSEAVMFGIRGALRLRSPKALPMIQKIAKRRFAYRSPQDAPIMSEKNAWWAQYEALSALAQWQGEKALPLLKRQAKHAPQVARLLALHLWKNSLPLIVSWAGSSRSSSRDLAYQALNANVPAQALRETREEMLKVLRDPKADRELRHQLALKIGLSSTENEVGALLNEYRAASDPDTKLMLSAALFASRSQQVVPVLLEHAKTHPDPRLRAGARAQLKDMLPAADYKALTEWAAANETDPDNRSDAQRELRTPR